MFKHKAWATTFVWPKLAGSMTTKGQMKPTFRAPRRRSPRRPPCGVAWDAVPEQSLLLKLRQIPAYAPLERAGCGHGSRPGLDAIAWINGVHGAGPVPGETFTVRAAARGQARSQGRPCQVAEQNVDSMTRLVVAAAQSFSNGPSLNTRPPPVHSHAYCARRRRGGDSPRRIAQGLGQAQAPRRSFRPEARSPRPGSAPRRASANLVPSPRLERVVGRIRARLGRTAAFGNGRQCAGRQWQRQAVATAGSGNGRQLVAAADGVQSDCRRRQGDAAPAQGESEWWGRSGLGDAGVCKQRRRCEEEAGRHSSACRTPPPQTPRGQGDTLPAISSWPQECSAVIRAFVSQFLSLERR